MKAYVCDRCKKVVTDEKQKKDMFNLQNRTDNIGMFAEHHLCDVCKKEFYKFIDGEQILELKREEEND